MESPSFILVLFWWIQIFDIYVIDILFNCNLILRQMKEDSLRKGRTTTPRQQRKPLPDSHPGTQSFHQFPHFEIPSISLHRHSDTHPVILAGVQKSLHSAYKGPTVKKK